MLGGKALAIYFKNKTSFYPYQSDGQVKKWLDRATYLGALSSFHGCPTNPSTDELNSLVQNCYFQQLIKPLNLWDSLVKLSRV